MVHTVGAARVTRHSRYDFGIDFRSPIYMTQSVSPVEFSQQTKTQHNRSCLTIYGQVTKHNRHFFEFYFHVRAVCL